MEFVNLFYAKVVKSLLFIRKGENENAKLAALFIVPHVNVYQGSQIIFLDLNRFLKVDHWKMLKS